MRRPLFRAVLPALAVLTAVACSTQKDAFLNRAFHRLVARDNGWFNANVKLNETVEAMQKAYVDDYDKVLPIFVIGSEEQAKAIVPDMETCIEKCGVVIDRNSMEFNGKEKNKWIDDAWFVIGKSHFYKRSYLDALRTFDYIGRRFKGQDKQMVAKVWLARTAIELEQYAKAQSALDEVKSTKVLPKHFPHDQLSAVQADLDLRRGKVDDGIMALEHAVQITRTKKDRVRWSFILAQLYQLKGQDNKAIAEYNKVTHMGPPYEMGFHARIFQALAFNRGNSKGIRHLLERMLRDEKNVDHFDLIHYALADLDLKENRKDDAIAELKTSCRTSTTDTKQKAKSFLKLADLYFNDKRYHNAQQYYDSTSTLLATDNPRFDEVKTRAEVLGDLVKQLNIIAREDSLQAFAKLDPDEREKRIREMIRDRERDEAQKAQEESDARDLLASNPANPADAGTPAAGGAWYFYNHTQVARGIAEFKKKWGNRPNDDDWRRSDKSGTALVDVAAEEAAPEDSASASLAPGEPAWKDPKSYLKGLPTDAASLDSSNSKICTALYLSGMIYKEKLKDVDNAIESFEVLNKRFDDCHYTPEAYYQLYRIYLAKEQAGNFMDFGGNTSKHYSDIILKRWPDSEFARLVRNPDQLQADQAAKIAENKAYEGLYGSFRQGAYMEVIAACDTVIGGEPHNHLLAKYHLLRAMSIGGLHQMGPFRDELEVVKRDFPGSDEAKAAQAILANMDHGGAKAKTGPPAEKPPAYAAGKGAHYVVLMVPGKAGRMPQVLAAISDFDQHNFRNIPIQVKTSVYDDSTQVVMIKLFQTKQKAMDYYNLFKANKTDLKGINDKGWPLFAISTGNYAQFFTSKDVGKYEDFFTHTYLAGK